MWEQLKNLISHINIRTISVVLMILEISETHLVQIGKFYVSDI